MTPPRTHSQNREVMCGICYRKDKNLRKISPDHLIKLQNLVDSRYSLTDPMFQTVLCVTCLSSLSAHSRNPDNPDRGRKLLKPKYVNLTPPPSHNTRGTADQSCPCTVCEIARETVTPGFGSRMLQQRHWELLFPDIDYPVSQVL